MTTHPEHSSSQTRAPEANAARFGAFGQSTLAAHHREVLQSSGLDNVSIEERGYFTAERKSQLADLGFSRAQQLVPALVLPVISPHGEVVLYQARPDRPRVKNAKAVKYETLPGASMALDVPPRSRPLLGDPSIPLFVTEGIKKGDSLATRGLCAVALLGVWNWRGTNDRGGKVALPEWESIALNDRQVFIVFDSDVMLKTAVHAAMQRLADFLRSRSANVLFIYLPAGAAGAKVGVDDFLASGNDIDDLLKLATDKLRPVQPADSSTPGSRSARPEIVVSDRHVRDMTADAVSVLQRQPEPLCFRRGSAIVRLVGEPRLAEVVTIDAIRGTLDRLADFISLDAEGRAHPARVPRDVAADILSLADSPLPPLAGVLSSPVFLEGGRLLCTPGYDTESGFYLNLKGFDGLRADIPLGEAVALLMDEVLGDFPFADDGSRAHTVAAIIQPFVRPMIDGPVPLYLLDAPTRGTGKTLLADAIAHVALASSAPVMALPRDNDEIEKRITSMLIGGAPLVLLDNVTSLQSGALAAVLTTTIWRGRVLGRSQIVQLENRATWLATGNNVGVSDELARRIAPIRLDAGEPHPEGRKGFRHSDLLAWVRAHRPSLVSACLSIVQAWIDAGCPSDSSTLGRFESWTHVMGGILAVAGVDGFLSNRGLVLEQADQTSADWAALCAAWWEEFESRPVTAKDLFLLAKGRSLLLDLWGGRTELGAQQRFGHALPRVRDRVFGRFRIQAVGRDATTGNAAYRLENRRSEDTRNAGDTGSSSPDARVSGVSGVSARAGEDSATRTPDFWEAVIR
ncbi:MAG: DUF3854 domain-containing protein [Dehalococcoidia bacterium]